MFLSAVVVEDAVVPAEPVADAAHRIIRCEAAVVANLTAGVRYFEARPTQTETDADVKTGTVTVATSVIAGYGNALAGYVTKIDIVTP